jgi:hypothetical protein
MAEADHARHPDGLIDALAAGLSPVRRLRPPLARALLWLLAPTAIGLAVAAGANWHAFALRFMGAPDLRTAMIASTVTAILAAIATFELSMPDRSGAWGLLPVPALLVWVGASGLGCLRDWLVPGTRVAGMHEAEHCFYSILVFSAPLSLLLLAMLRRARPLRPGLVTLMGGLTVAAAAATLLWLVHPYDAAPTDLLMHLAAVLLVVLGNAAATRVIATA